MRGETPDLSRRGRLEAAHRADESKGTLDVRLISESTNRGLVGSYRVPSTPDITRTNCKARLQFRGRVTVKGACQVINRGK